LQHFTVAVKPHPPSHLQENELSPIESPTKVPHPLRQHPPDIAVSPAAQDNVADSEEKYCVMTRQLLKMPNNL